MEIIVDSFDMSDFLNIKASCIIDSIDKDFVIDRAEFEVWCDEHELRDYERDIYSNHGEYAGTGMLRHEWADLYDDHTYMYELLKMYIQHLYDMNTMDIETPIKKILL
jgi:hypothetical protein